MESNKMPIYEITIKNLVTGASDKQVITNVKKNENTDGLYLDTFHTFTLVSNNEVERVMSKGKFFLLDTADKNKQAIQKEKFTAMLASKKINK